MSLLVPVRLFGASPIACLVALLAATPASALANLLNPEPRNVSYIDLQPDLCPPSQRIYPGRQGGSCPSGSLTDYRLRTLTEFGGRPRWNSDGTKLAFVEGEYAEAYELDVASGEVACITCDFSHQGIYRIYYMNNDDYLILSTPLFVQNTLNRFLVNAIYWMPADRSQPPEYLGEEHFEGVAVSRSSRTIAWFTSVLNNARPSELILAEISEQGELKNKRTVRLPFWGLDPWLPFEAQDLFAHDAGLIFSHYSIPTQTYSYNFYTGELINQTRSSAHEEPEGLFPDNTHAAMEGDRHIFAPDAPDYDQSIRSDVYMLRLDGTGRTAYRLTHEADLPQRWANNPNVSADGCSVAYFVGEGPTSSSNLTGTFAGIRVLEFHQCLGGHQSDRLHAGDTLYRNQWLESENGEYRLLMQEDGNLVLSSIAGDTVWSSGTANQHGDKLVLQQNGSAEIISYGYERFVPIFWFIGYHEWVSPQPIWSTDSDGSGTATLIVGNDGVLRLLLDGAETWRSE